MIKMVVGNAMFFAFVAAWYIYLGASSTHVVVPPVKEDVDTTAPFSLTVDGSVIPTDMTPSAFPLLNKPYGKASLARAIREALDAPGARVTADTHQ